MLYGNIAMTLVVQLAFSYLMHTIQGGKGALQTTLLFFGVLFGFGFGGFGGTLLAIQYSELSLLLPAFLLILLMIYLFFAKLEIDAPIDPDA